jgi:hypothetical protein
MRNIYTINLQTGIPDKRLAKVIEGVAHYRENGWEITVFGGFYTSFKAANVQNRKLAMERLQEDKDYSNRMRKAGIFLNPSKEAK